MLMSFCGNGMTIDVTFDLAVFSLDAVKTACYRFLDRFTSDIELRDGMIICHLVFDDKWSEAFLSANVNNLKKEVLDQDLRLKLKAETEPIRNLIFAHAFSKTGLIADE
jgi:His-Xaa-Ser system protein HxsD